MEDFDYVAVQRKWQALWLEKKAFEPAVERGRKKFFFTVPYPYVSGLLHVGHGRTYTNGDVIARFHRMKGENVLWPMGFHITGTPVMAVSAKIAAGEAATTAMFEEYVSIYEQDKEKVTGIVAGFSDPWNLVNYFSKKLVQDFQSMGFSLDLSRQFTTGDAEYNKFIEWQFKRFKDKGYLKQAGYPILYCAAEGNAVGEDDIKDADTVPVEVMKFTAVKFALEGSDEFLVSSTLRPDTIYGVTNMFANPAAEYVLASVQMGNCNEKWWVGAKAAEKLALQGAKVEIIDRKQGDWFVGKKITTPAGSTVPILPGNFVDAGHASGFVHSVPAHAPYDWVALEELKKDGKTLGKYPGLEMMIEQIKPISLITVPGYGEYPAGEIVARMKIVSTRDRNALEKATQEIYRKEFYEGKMKPINKEFAGMKVADAKEAMGEWLKKSGKAADFYETSRPAACRCGGQVACAVMQDQWFIDYNSEGWKDKARACLAAMQIHPAMYRKQFEDVLEWLDKRPCARKRGLGTKLPFDSRWIIESLSDSTIYMAFYTLVKNIRKFCLKPEQLTPELFDAVFLGKGNVVSGVPDAVVKEMREEFLYWYPNDLRHTGTAHVSNHLSFFIFAHAGILEPRHWPRAISLNELVISEGTKMSKSKGNVVLLNRISSTVGADVFRLYAAGAADFQSVLDYRQKEVEATRRTLGHFVSTITELAELGAKAWEDAKPEKLTTAQAWFLSKFETAVVEGTKALEEFRVRDYIQAVFYSLMKYYDHFSRRATPEEKRGIASAVAPRWVKLLAPVTPHTCEELWEKLGGKEFASKSQWPPADAKLKSNQAERQEDLVLSVIEDARKIMFLLRKKGTPKKATVFTASKEKWLELARLIETNSTPDAISTPNADLKAYAEKEFYSLKTAGVSEFDEAAVLAEAKLFLEKELGISVEVLGESGSANPRAPKAMPLRPAIALE